MPEEQPTFAVADERKEVDQLRAVIGFIDHKTDRVLHPAIGEQNP